MDLIGRPTKKNDIIKVFRTRIGGHLRQAVNARDLWEFLEVRTAFKDWVTRRIQEYSFIEGSDFCLFVGESTGGRPLKDYHITLGMAKELSMVERNERGKIARKYFIECEERFKEHLSKGIDLASSVVMAVEPLISPLKEFNQEQMQSLRKVESSTALGFKDVSGKVESVEKNLSVVRDQITNLWTLLPRKSISKADKERHILCVFDAYRGICPCCNSAQIVGPDMNKLPPLQFDHFYDKSKNKLFETWPICVDCNQKRENNSLFREESAKHFESYKARLRDYLPESKDQMRMF